MSTIQPSSVEGTVHLSRRASRLSHVAVRPPRSEPAA